MNTARVEKFFRGVVAFCCVCIIGACPASFGLPVPPVVDTDAEGAPNGALPDAPTASSQVTVKGLPLAIVKDQIPIWTSPIRIRPHDLLWLLPLGAAVGTTLATDTDSMRDLSHDRTFNKDNVNASNYLLGSEIAVPVALFGIGAFKGNAHARETGILSGEALADAVVVEEVSKIILRRERPLVNNAAGDFFAPNVGTNGSFPSSHSTLAWSIAAVMAGEYPSKWVQAGVYTAATGVSLTRVLGQEHFPTDVLVGGVAGWLIGHYVSKKHSGWHVVHRL
jgi:membrane-associated phospholipid phosphatase